MVHHRALRPEQVPQVLAYQQQMRCKFGEAVLKLYLVPRDVFLRLLAGHLNVPFVRTEALDKVPVATVRMVPTEVLARLRVCPLKLQPGSTRGTLYVATSHPENLVQLDEVSFATGCIIQPVLALADDIERVLLRYRILDGRHQPIELPPEEDFRVEHDRYG
ncbi:pilus assembly protein PilB [Hyalangium minutum]|uniref:GspE/PulE/PilB domain-containing protein n=1 Tax=Hyalangium minutum TaxID=394096 RepID=UPI001F0A7F23|nr:pilus assembly protein PilB [Hyalangium minutum]